MNNHIFLAIGHLPTTLLKTQHFTALLRIIDDKGFLEVASRTRQQLCNIMRYAVQQGLTENNPALNLEGVTTPPVKNHYPALPLEPLSELLLCIDGYQQGRELTQLAVKLTLHLFIRSSELRFPAEVSLISETKSGPSLPPVRRSTKYVTPGVAQKCVLRILCRCPGRRLPF